MPTLHPVAVVQFSVFPKHSHLKHFSATFIFTLNVLNIVLY